MSAANIASAFVGGGLSYAGNILQNEFQKHNDAAARQWQEKMVREANAFNDPSAVMARMKQAGINPNLIAGQPVAGSASVPNASTGSRAPNFDDIAPNVLNALSTAHQMKLADEQQANQNEKTAAEVRYIDEQARALKGLNDAEEKYGVEYGVVKSEEPDLSGGISFDSENKATLPELKLHFVKPRNSYEQSVYDKHVTTELQHQGFRDTHNLSSEELALKHEEVAMARERTKRYGEILAQEIEKGRLTNQQIEHAIVAMLPDVVTGLSLKNAITYDENGYPVSVNNWDMVITRIGQTLRELGLGDLLGDFMSVLIRGKLGKGK